MHREVMKANGLVLMSIVKLESVIPTNRSYGSQP